MAGLESGSRNQTWRDSQEPADLHGNWPWKRAETSATSQTCSPGALGWEKLQPGAGRAVIPTDSRVSLDLGACRRTGAPIEAAFIQCFYTCGEQSFKRRDKPLKFCTCAPHPTASSSETPRAQPPSRATSPGLGKGAVNPLQLKRSPSTSQSCQLLVPPERCFAIYS